MRRSIETLAGAGLSLTLVLSGCKVGPNYARPTVEQPSAFKSQAATQPATQPALPISSPVVAALSRRPA